MIASGLFWALYTVELKKCPKVNPAALMVWIAIVSLPMVITLTVIFENNQISLIQSLSGYFWLGLLYLGLAVSVLAHGLWYYLMQRYPIQLIAPFALLVPIFGVAGGVIFLKEPMTTNMIVGTIIMLIGLVIIHVRRPEILQTDIDA